MPFVHAKSTLVGVALVLASAGLLGASVIFDAPQPAGEYVAYPVTVSLLASEHAAGIQFDIELDLGAVEFVDVQAGPAAENAGKDVVFSMLDDDTVRVLVLGMNQDQLASGVVANVYVTTQGSTGAAAPLTLGPATFSDPAGNPVVPEADPASDDADSGEDGDSSYEPGESGEPAADGDANRSADSGSKNGEPAASTGGMMPALLDAFLGDDYGSMGSAQRAGDAQRASGSVGSAGAAGTAGTRNQPPPQEQAAHSEPGYLPPQAYRSAAGSVSNIKPKLPRPDFNSKPTARDVPAPVSGAETDRTPVAAAPLRVNWPAPAVTPPATSEPAAPGALAFDDKIDLSRYANRRAVLPASACLVALVLVLRNACAPLLRLLRDVARF